MTMPSNLPTQNLIRPNQLNGTNDNTLDGKIMALRGNRLAFLPADQIIIEKTTNGGTTWEDAGVSNDTKLALFSETRPYVSLPLKNGVRSTDCGLRITFTGMKYNVPNGTSETQKYNYWNSNYVVATERYCQLKEMYFWVSSVNDAISVKLEKATGAAPNNWSVSFENTNYAMTGWGGSDYIRFSQNVFGGGTNQTGNYWNYRLTFFTRGSNGSMTLSTNSNYASITQGIQEIRGYGDACWQKGNEYAGNDKIYTHDIHQNVTFPSNINANNFIGKINGHTVNKDVPADAKFTDTITTASTTGSGNAVTAISATNGALTVTKGTTFLTSH